MKIGFHKKFICLVFSVTIQKINRLNSDCDLFESFCMIISSISSLCCSILLGLFTSTFNYEKFQIWMRTQQWYKPNLAKYHILLKSKWQRDFYRSVDFDETLFPQYNLMISNIFLCRFLAREIEYIEILNQATEYVSQPTKYTSFLRAHFTIFGNSFDTRILELIVSPL